MIMIFTMHNNFYKKKRRERKMASKSIEWFNENVSENEKDLRAIAVESVDPLYQKLSINFDPDVCPDYQEMIIAMYGVIFNEICNEIVEKEKEWDSFSLNIADRLKIGYTTTDDEDDEKTGNFMVFMQNTMKDFTNSKADEPKEKSNFTVELATQWNAANIKVQADVLKSIAARSKKALSDVLDIKSETHEFIIPFFCMVHSEILKYLKLQKEELSKSEYELNIAGLYTIGIQETDDAEDNIYYVPSISLKLKFKNDSVASAEG